MVNLRETTLLKNLSDREFETWKLFFTEEFHSDGALIFEKDEPSSDVYVILAGGVKVLNYGPDGHMIFFKVRTAGDFFGYYSGITNEPRTANMYALGDTTVAKIQHEHFIRMIYEVPAVCHCLLMDAVHTLRRDTMRITNKRSLTARSRVIFSILDQTRAQENKPVKLFSRAEWAAHVDMSRETLSRILSEFVKLGAIDISRSELTIRDVNLLRSFYQG